MARRTKKTVWHKKQQKFISSTALKPHRNPPAQENVEAGSATADRKKMFAKDLIRKIRQAVRAND